MAPTILTIATCVIGLVLFNLVVHALAVKYIFVWQKNDSIELKSIIGIGFLTILVCFVILPTQTGVGLVQSCISLLLTVSSMFFFWGAIIAKGRRTLSIAFTQDPPQFLIQSGPYQLVRHPFYVAYSLNWISASVISFDGIVMAGTLLLICLYYRAAVFEEAKFSQTKFAKKYLQYQQSTGMFLPKVLGRLTTQLRG